jgi:fused signal recognition particle receptor
MSKLFGWFSKNKKAEKQKEQQTQEQAAKEAESSLSDATDTVIAETETTEASPVDKSVELSSEKSAENLSAQTAANVQEQEAVSQITPTVTDGNEAIHNTIVDAVESGEKQPLDFSSDKVDELSTEPRSEAVTPLDNASTASVEEEVLAEESAAHNMEAPNADTSVDSAAAVPAAPSAEDNTKVIAEVETSKDESAKADAVTPEKEKKSLFARLKESLSRTKENLGSGIVSLFKGKAIDDELYEDLETQLLVADVGMDTTQKIINHLTDSASRKDLKDAEALLEILKQQMSGMLANVNVPLSDALQKHDATEGPFVILMVGVNGVGKTTTIGKLAKQFQQQGKKVMLAAGDTFRAAAVEQLQVWGERNSIPVIAQHTGADSASVLYDALEAAKSRGSDILIADTAGRLQNKNNLMEELKKVVRVMKKLNPNAPHEVMLTLDAGTGQNAISQAKLFNEAVGLTGITLTKLDGTAKGGVIFSVADQFGIPIRYIGVGEGIDDLRQFDGEEFIDALFSELDTPAS